jgi:hypothetical protein
MMDRLAARLSIAALCLLRAHAGAALPAFNDTCRTLDTLVAGDTARVDFAFTNTSGETLVIEQANPSCGCLVHIDRTRQYGPGDTGTVSTTVIAGGLPDGHIEMSVMFRPVDDSAAQRSETILLRVLAPVRHEVRFVPEVLGACHPGGKGSAAVSAAIRNESGRTVRVESLALDTPTVLDVYTRQLPYALAPGDSLPFVVLLQPGRAPAAIKGIQSRIHAYTSGTRYGEHSCDVYFYLQ